MRRVDRGPWPEEHGKPKAFGPYQLAKRDLLDRLGPYCSYCERTGDLHVEHVVPKCHRDDLRGEWTNLLLGCANCNGTKGSRNDSRDGYTWPDDDVTWSPFEYLPEGRVRVADGLPEGDRLKAERLFELVGLGRRPTRDPKASDQRFLRRQEAWRTAELALGKLVEGLCDLDMVTELAQATGFWSVWMTVFTSRADVRERLRAAFPGTSRQATPT